MKGAGVESLTAKFLSFGGERVVTMSDPHPALLLDRGRIFPTERRRRVRGRRYQAHQNAALYYLNHLHFGRGEGLDLVSGYALHGGLWCPHTWLWNDRQVLETSGCPDLYFGFILNMEEVSEFVHRAVTNVLPWLRPVARRPA